MTKAGLLLRGLALGAVGAYFFDPQSGRRRRAVLRDRSLRQLHRLQHGVDVACRDASHRVQGTAAAARSLVRHDEVEDDVLIERVRAALGHYVSHPRAIHVAAQDGRVTLSGRLRAEELVPFVQAVHRVRGVCAVESQLDVVEDSSLGPGTGHANPSVHDWTPTTRLVVGGAGAWLVLRSLARGGLGGKIMGALGTGMVTRAATNLESRRLLGLGPHARGIDFHKSVHIAAPLERVYELLAHPENLPRFARNVAEVAEVEPGRVQGKLLGPAGLELPWEEIVHRVPNERLTWKSAAGSLVPYFGVARFFATEQGTRVDVQMTYNPPAGVFAHAAAAIVGADPKSFLDDLLVRAKGILETGRAPHNAVDPSPGEFGAQAASG